MHEPQITLTGNLGWPPRLRTVAGGTSVADFRVACTQRRRDAQGEWSDGETLWFGVTCWRQLAENAAASLKKGDRVVVAGRLAQRTWRGDDGVEHVNLEIEASSVGVDLNRCVVSVERPARKGAAEDLWASTGVINNETSEVEVQPVGDAGPLSPLDDGEEIAA